jgi:hypothetical protein
MHASRAGSGQARTKLLYLFRSPSHVQIGRRPLDPEVREALEHTHPDLTFDWNGLLRDSPVPSRQPRVDPREHNRAGRTGRSQKPAGRSGGGNTRPDGRPDGRAEARPEGRAEHRADARPARPVPPAPQLPEDHSSLGQGVGAAEAARLRHRYAELAQRVGRRSRTPEERDRLTAELSAVNPDEWTGSEVIRQEARTADSRWDAIAAQLPKRRRGRRGGRADGASEQDGPDQTLGSDVIIGERENTDEGITNDLQLSTTGVASVSGPAGDRHPDRPDEAGAAPSDAAGADTTDSEIR